MNKFFTQRKLNIIASVTAIVLMWVVWLIAFAAVKNEYLIPPVAQSVKEFFNLFALPFFWKALGSTVLRTLIAFIISFVLAALFVALSCVFKPFASFVRPIVALLRSVPTMAILLLILVWTTPVTAPVVVAFLALFPICYTQLSGGVSGVDKALVEMAKTYKVKRSQVLIKIYLSSMAPQIISQTGANLSFGIKLIISAEVMASTYTAVGGMMAEAQAFINLPRLAALTLFAVIFGIVVEVIFSLISRFAFPWQRGCVGVN